MELINYTYKKAVLSTICNNFGYFSFDSLLDSIELPAKEIKCRGLTCTNPTAKGTKFMEF